jgi:hypothetical protein
MSAVGPIGGSVGGPIGGPIGGPAGGPVGGMPMNGGANVPTPAASIPNPTPAASIPGNGVAGTNQSPADGGQNNQAPMGGQLQGPNGGGQMQDPNGGTLGMAAPSNQFGMSNGVGQQPNQFGMPGNGMIGGNGGFAPMNGGMMNGGMMNGGMMNGVGNPNQGPGGGMNNVAQQQPPIDPIPTPAQSIPSNNINASPPVAGGVSPNTGDAPAMGADQPLGSIGNMMMGNNDLTGMGTGGGLAAGPSSPAGGMMGNGGNQELEINVTVSTVPPKSNANATNTTNTTKPATPTPTTSTPETTAARSGAPSAVAGSAAICAIVIAAALAMV